MKTTAQILYKNENCTALMKLTIIFFLILFSGISNKANAVQLSDREEKYHFGISFTCVDEKCKEVKYRAIIGDSLSPREFKFDKKKLFSEVKKINRKKYMKANWKSKKWEAMHEMEGLMGFRQEIGKSGAVCGGVAVASAGVFDVLKMPFAYLSELSKANKSSKLLVKQFDNALENNHDGKYKIDTFDFSVIRDAIYKLIGEDK